MAKSGTTTGTATTIISGTILKIAYRVYLGEQHREYREFGGMRAARQREYLKWRHEHPDSTLFKVEVR